MVQVGYDEVDVSLLQFFFYWKEGYQNLDSDFFGEKVMCIEVLVVLVCIVFFCGVCVGVCVDDLVLMYVLVFEEVQDCFLILCVDCVRLDCVF